LELEYRADNKRSTANGIRMVINNLIDYQKSEIIYTRDITVDFLKGFERYLKKLYEQIRTKGPNVNQLTRMPGLKESSIATQFFLFKLIFNSIRNKYYDQNTSEYKISNYPFKLFKISTPVPSEDEKKELPIPFIKIVRDCKTRPGSVAELVQHINMLSFYLCGLKGKDIYNLNKIKNGRISYNRSKTEGKRKDNAYIGIKVIPEAEILLDKYLVKIRTRYKNSHCLQKAICNGNVALKNLICEQFPDSKYLSYELLFGIFRHAFADEIHNKLGYKIAQVGEALNHGYITITHRYIKKKWDLIDEMQAGVVDLLREK